MEIGSSTSGSVAQANQQQARQVETETRQTELATSDSQPAAENNPSADSRVGSVIDTRA